MKADVGEPQDHSPDDGEGVTVSGVVQEQEGDEESHGASSGLGLGRTGSMTEPSMPSRRNM